MLKRICISIKNGATNFVDPNLGNILDSCEVVAGNVKYALQQVDHMSVVYLEQEASGWWTNLLEVPFVELNRSLVNQLRSDLANALWVAVDEGLAEDEAVNLLDVHVVGGLNSDCTEVPSKSFIYKLFASRSRANWGDKVDFLDLLKVDSFVVVPTAEVEELADELVCTLVSPVIFISHV